MTTLLICNSVVFGVLSIVSILLMVFAQDEQKTVKTALVVGGFFWVILCCFLYFLSMNLLALSESW